MKKLLCDNYIVIVGVLFTLATIFGVLFLVEFLGSYLRENPLDEKYGTHKSEYAQKRKKKKTRNIVFLVIWIVLLGVEIIVLR